MRGCSRGQYDTTARLAFPRVCGVVPEFAGQPPLAELSPRVCGVVPERGQVIVTRQKFPRTCGVVPQSLVALACRHSLFPAYAGLFPQGLNPHLP